MGTRGLYGFRKYGHDKLTYNHYDSYPEILGKEVLTFISSTNLQFMNFLYHRLLPMNQHGSPDPKVINDYIKAGFIPDIKDNPPEDYYSLLQPLQGKLDWMLDALSENLPVYITEDSEFIKDSLFCEFVYIINLDTEELEFYTGFQAEPAQENRYGQEPDGDWYPCKMVLKIPFEDIKPNNTADILLSMRYATNEDYEKQEDIHKKLHSEQGL